MPELWAEKKSKINFKTKVRLTMNNGTDIGRKEGILPVVIRTFV